MALTAKFVEAAKPKEKRYRVLDADNLLLEVTPSGGKSWRFRYRLNGKADMISLGRYPEISLKEARQLRDKKKVELAKGIDPKQVSKLRKQSITTSNTFQDTANEWLAQHITGKSEKHIQAITGRLNRYVFPAIGTRIISELDAHDIHEIVQTLAQHKKIELARRIRGLCSQIFRYAILMRKTKHNPAHDIIGLLPSEASVRKHHPALTDPRDVGGLMRGIDGYQGDFIVQSLVKTAAYTFLRSSELRKATWAEIDFDRNEWRIPQERMKMRRPHIVPLSKQVTEILQAIRPITQNAPFIFPGVWKKDRPISSNTINGVLRRLGYSKDEMTCHGFRGTASSLLNAQGFNKDVIERQLAHAERNQVRAAYNHTDYMQERRDMMQWYADYLDNLKQTAS